MPDRVLKILAENFEVSDDIVVRSKDRLGMADFMELARIDRPDLQDPPLVQRTTWREGEPPEEIFEKSAAAIRSCITRTDSFESVEQFLSAAAEDPQVIAIKMTLYRIGANPPLVGLLIQAAKLGKQVTVLVELKARMDERANIEWAKRLEARRIHVIYGFPDLKTHAKLCLSGPQGTGRYPALRAHQHRELQPRDLTRLHGHRPVHLRQGRGGRRFGCLQLPDRLFEPETFSPPAGGADRSAFTAGRADQAGGRTRPAKAVLRASSSS